MENNQGIYKGAIKWPKNYILRSKFLLAGSTEVTNPFFPCSYNN